MLMSNWSKFPHDSSAFTYVGGSLLDSWPDLHGGDCVEFPDVEWVKECLDEAPEAAPDAFDGDYAALAEKIHFRFVHDFAQGNVSKADCCHVN